MDLLLSRCLELGSRPARPGEFTERAFLNGKLDLTQAEAIADLIESTTAVGARLAVRSLQGVFSSRVRTIVDELVRWRAYLEAMLDFADEQIDTRAPAEFAAALTTLIASVTCVLSEAQQGERIRDGLTVVIAGRPNVGKSSLLNVLVKSEAAIVSDAPGTTRDLLRCDIQIDGLPVRVIDTAGIRETQEPVEREGVRRARDQLLRADHILWVYDKASGIKPEDLESLPPGIKVILVRNKIDLDAPGDSGYCREVIPEVRISVITGEGIEELRNQLKYNAGIAGLGEGSFTARRRHLDALRRGLIALNAAQSSLEIGAGLEFIALELSDAQRSFGEITGEFTPDDLLGRIFSTFCIGK